MAYPVGVTAHLGELLALGASFLWSACAVAFTAAARKAGSQAVNFARLPLGVVCLVAAHWVLLGTPWPEASVETQAWLAASGLVGLTVGDGFLFWAYTLIGPRRALLMMAMAPVFTVLTAWVGLGEHLGPRALSGIAVILAGVALATQGRDPGAGTFSHLPPARLRLGLAAGLAAGACQGVGATLAKAGMAHLDPLGATVLRMAWATVGMTAAAAVLGRLREWVTAWRHRESAAPLLAGVVLGPFLGVWASLAAFKLAPTGVAMALAATVPITILPFARFYHGDRMSRLALVGTVVAVAGGVLLFLR